SRRSQRGDGRMRNETLFASVACMAVLAGSSQSWAQSLRGVASIGNIEGAAYGDNFNDEDPDFDETNGQFGTGGNPPGAYVRHRSLADADKLTDWVPFNGTDEENGSWSQRNHAENNMFATHLEAVDRPRSAVGIADNSVFTDPDKLPKRWGGQTFDLVR